MRHDGPGLATRPCAATVASDAGYNGSCPLSSCVSAQVPQGYHKSCRFVFGSGVVVPVFEAGRALVFVFKPTRRD